MHNTSFNPSHVQLLGAFSSGANSAVKISKIVAGGQSGVDRAALDVAIMQGIEYGGWCPKGGWAQDYPNTPGLLQKYPNLRETPSSKPEQRTRWNVRDSSATLILVYNSDLQTSKGTKLTHDIAIELGKPVLISELNKDDSRSSISEWISTLGSNIVLNVAGPRESEYPGIYSRAKEFLGSIYKY